MEDTKLTIDDLPLEMIYLILSFVNYPLLTVFVCRQWKALSTRIKYDKTIFLSEILRNKHLHVFRWAIKNGCSWNKLACFQAARNGNLTILKWAANNRRVWYRRSCRYAAQYGHINIIIWITNIYANLKEDREICGYAARGDYSDTLKWLREHGFVWDSRTCIYAARNNRTNILKWAIENGCPGHEMVCTNIAKYGHLDLLQLARIHNIPWDQDTCSYAAKYGYLNVLKWAIDNGCPLDKNKAYENATINKHSDIIAFLDKI